MINMDISVTPNYSYIFDFENDFIHQRTRKWMLENWTWVFYYCGIYMLVIFGGQHFMQNRPRWVCHTELNYVNYSSFAIKKHVFFGGLERQFSEITVGLRTCALWPWKIISWRPGSGVNYTHKCTRPLQSVETTLLFIETNPWKPLYWLSRALFRFILRKDWSPSVHLLLAQTAVEFHV